MKGALVFIVVFLVGVVVTTSNTSIPPGLNIYYMLGFPDTNYPILGLPAPVFAASILNGVIYGIIAWLLYSLAASTRKQKLEVVVKQEPPK